MCSKKFSSCPAQSEGHDHIASVQAVGAALARGSDWVAGPPAGRELICWSASACHLKTKTPARRAHRCPNWAGFGVVLGYSNSERGQQHSADERKDGTHHQHVQPQPKG